MKSNWQESRAKSTYHFDNKRVDPAQDRVIVLGHIEPTWLEDVESIVAGAAPVTWATRGYKSQDIQSPPEELVKEEYDLEQFGYGADYEITHLNWTIPESLIKISNDIGLQDCMSRIHVQQPGEVWNLHLDKLQKWCPEDPSRVMRIMIQLTDWHPGQFWEYGNYHHKGWRAGEVTTFDWANLPHSTANAGHYARVTLQLTGVVTEQTQQYLAQMPQ